MSTLLQSQQRQEQAPRVFEGVTLGIGKGGEGWGWSHGETRSTNVETEKTRERYTQGCLGESPGFESQIYLFFFLVRGFASFGPSLLSLFFSFFLFLSHPCARCPRRTTFSSDTRFHLCCLWYLARCCHAHPPCPPCSLPRVVRSSRIRPPAVLSLSLLLFRFSATFFLPSDRATSSFPLLRSSNFMVTIMVQYGDNWMKTLNLASSKITNYNREIWTVYRSFLYGFWISFFLFLRMLFFHFSDYAQSRPAFLQTRFRLISISIIPARYYPWVG